MTPKLIHPVKIHLVQINPTLTPAKDPDFQEPLDSPVRRPPLMVTAQLGMGKTDQYAQRPGGDDPQSDGHVVLRVVDWKREGQGRKLNKGDRITGLYVDREQQGDVQAVRWVVTEVRPAAHYRGGHRFWLLYYQDQKVGSVG